MDVVIIGIIALFGFVVIVRIVSRGNERIAGKNRCTYCRARLKKTRDRLHYADVCNRCGRTQPWAQREETPGPLRTRGFDF